MKYNTQSTYLLTPLYVVIASLSLFAGGSRVLAQQDEAVGNTTLPSCSTVAYDSDGDGYGWVPLRYEPFSCIVDENTRPKPLYAMTNGALQPLNLIRTYWDPNVDFADKEIECENHGDQSFYWFEPPDTFKIKHRALPDVTPYMSEYEITYGWDDSEYTNMNLWRAADGIYLGQSHFYNPDDAIVFYARYWGEPVEIDGQQGMRFYNATPVNGDTEVISGDFYQECKYTSGLPFRPTGSWGTAPTPSGQTMQDIPVLAAGPSIDTMPEYVHQATGETVELRSFSWNVTNDLLFKTIYCEDANWDGYAYDPFYYGYDAWTFMPPAPAQKKGSVYFNLYGRNLRSHGEWWIEDGNLKTDISFPAASGWYEKLDSNDGSDWMRIWYSETSIDNCFYEHDASLIPTGDVLVQSDVTGESGSSDQTTDDTSGTASEADNTDTNIDTAVNTGTGTNNDSTSESADTTASAGDNTEVTQSVVSGGGSSSGADVALLISLWLFLGWLRLGNYQAIRAVFKA